MYLLYGLEVDLIVVEVSFQSLASDVETHLTLQDDVELVSALILLENDVSMLKALDEEVLADVSEILTLSQLLKERDAYHTLSDRIEF